MTKSQVTVAKSAVLVNLAVRKRVVKYLQPYFYQGGRWHKLKTKNK